MESAETTGTSISPVPPLTNPALQQRWRGIALAERVATQTHFTGLCHPLGVAIGATSDRLKKLIIANLCNAHPTWLAHAHPARARAVRSAYGWSSDEGPATVPEETILERLLMLSRERSGH